MPKIIDKEEKKIDILKVAIDEFYEHGIDNTAMKQIADSAGMGRTSLYSYFSSREDILRYALEYANNDFSNIRERLFHDPISTSGKIFKLLSSAFYEEQEIKKVVSVVMEYTVLLQRTRRGLDPNLLNFSHQLRRLFRELLLQGIESGEFIEHDVDHMSFILYSLTESFLLQEAFDGDITPYIDTKSLRLILHGITCNTNSELGGDQ